MTQQCARICLPPKCRSLVLHMGSGTGIAIQDCCYMMRANIQIHATTLHLPVSASTVQLPPMGSGTGMAIQDCFYMIRANIQIHDTTLHLPVPASTVEIPLPAQGKRHCIEIEEANSALLSHHTYKHPDPCHNTPPACACPHSGAPSSQPCALASPWPLRTSAALCFHIIRVNIQTHDTTLHLCVSSQSPHSLPTVSAQSRSLMRTKGNCH